MSKELYIEAHEELIDEYLERYPDASESEAYEATAELANDRMADKMASIIDRARCFSKGH